MTAAASPSPAFATLPRILAAGLAGGAVDFLYASGLALSRGRSLETLWQGVASGWMGKAAGGGGWATAGLGVLTHFGIATVMALVFALAAARLAFVRRRPLVWAVPYGVLLYAVMYGLVLPLRFGNPWRWNGLISVMDILAHIGLAVVAAAVLARRRAA